MSVAYKITSLESKLFGDCLLASLFVHCLNDSGIEAFIDKNFSIKELIDCKNESTNKDIVIYNFVYFNDKSKTIMQTAFEKFKQVFLIDINIQNKRDFIPIKFIEDENVQQVDVVLVTKTSKWAPVRDWPFFDELKSKLDALNITWIDCSRLAIKDNKFLNYVKKCKVFVTLETGASHYASQLVNKNNSLIIQSGYCLNTFWNSYNYDVISYKTECNNCFVIGVPCPFEHECMKKISADSVLVRILEKIRINKI